jgi:hypothetical protein
MKMTKPSLSIARALAFCLPLALIGSCGAPTGAKITFTPSATTITTGGPIDYGFNNYRITVLAANGIPLAGVKLTIIGAGDLYEGIILAMDCTADPCVPLSGQPALGQPYEATTDSNGIYDLTVAFPFGTAGSTITTVEAFSGNAYGNVDITYNE